MARILVIDDEAGIRSLIRQALTFDGHEITTAEEGEAGLRAFDQAAFDLVITDLFMPGMEGIETILALREKAPGIKILVASGGFHSERIGQGRLDPLADAEALGADASLPKPFEIGELRKVVGDLLSKP